MIRQFIFASRNQHKLKEVKTLLRSTGVKVLSLKEVAFDQEIEETGSTFEENAWIKANVVFDALGLPVIAEDSGLVVNTLNGAPGIHSARYSSVHGDDRSNINLLLHNLKGKTDRQAAFISALAVKMDDRSYTFKGRVNGTIGLKIEGGGGFGYDPIFIPEGYTKTFGQLSEETKDKISHRARVFDLLAAVLQKGM